MAPTPSPIILAGDPYTLGFEHGTRCRTQIHASMSLYARFFQETADLTWTEARKMALDFVPALQGHAKDLIDEMRGIADGADLHFEDVLAMNCRSEIALTGKTVVGGCTALGSVVPDDEVKDWQDGRVFLAQNWDWVPEAAETMVLLDVRPAGKPRMLMLTEAGLLGKTGMNEHGVGVCVNAIKCNLVDEKMLPVHVAVRRVLESRSCEDARGILDRQGVASCVNLLIGDARGTLASVECTPRGNAAICPVQFGGVVCHTNHLYSPTLLHDKKIRDRPSANSFSRLERIRELALDGHSSWQTIREWLSDEQGLPAAICRQLDVSARGADRMVTLATAIMELEQRRMNVSFGRPCAGQCIQWFDFCT